MNRRQLIKGAAAAIPVTAIPAAALVAATKTATEENWVADYPRVVWVALCRSPDFHVDTYPTFEAYAEAQGNLGRRVVQVLERASDLIVIVIEHRCSDMGSALRFLARFNEMCQRGTNVVDPEYEAEFGVVQSITAVDAGQVLDVFAFAKEREANQSERLARRVVKLEDRVAKMACPPGSYLGDEGGPEIFKPGKDVGSIKLPLTMDIEEATRLARANLPKGGE